MRVYPHKPKPKFMDTLREEHKASYEKNILYKPRDEPQAQIDFASGMAMDTFIMAAFEHAFEAPPAKVRSFIASAADFGELAIVHGYCTSPSEYMYYLSFAILAERERFLKTLQELPRERYTNPNVLCNEEVYLAATAMAHLSAGNYEEALQYSTAGIAVAPEGKDLDLRIMQAAASRSEQSFISALKKWKQKWIEKCGIHDQSSRDQPDNLLDILGLGFIAITHDAGLAVSEDDVYTPEYLLPRN